MANYFLGSVGKAEAFRVDEHGNRVLAFVSKTLTDSGLNISTTKDDIRAGQGAPIQFSFYHDPSVEITLTDVLWKKEYLTAQLGASFKNGTEDYVTDSFNFDAGSVTPDELKYGAPKALPIPCSDDNKVIIWAAPQGTEDWDLATYDEGTFTLTGKNAGKSGLFCVRYLGTVSSANIADISSLIIPEELYLIITAPIFAGDACAASKGKAAGHITFEVPRFQLNGSQEFSMNMSSNQTMSLAGIALASTSLECDAQGGKLLRIIEVIDDYDYKLDVANLIIDEESLVVGKAPVVYGELKNGTLKLIDNKDLTIVKNGTTTSALDENGKFAEAGIVTFTLKSEKNPVTDNATVAAA